MSQFRVEKQRAGAEVTLLPGTRLRGAFFLAGSSATDVGRRERIGDLLNAEPGFVPFETTASDAGTLLLNRAHLITVRLLDGSTEPRLDPGYDIATARRVAMLLTDGRTLRGCVRVYRPHGHERVSDYARSPEIFRYLETPDGTFIVNSAHIVSIYETD
jgi:hypothetical protein